MGYAYDGGSDWELDTIATMTTGVQGASLALALDSADRPHLCYYDYDAGTSNHATHNGTAWQVDIVDDVFYNGQHCSLAIDSSDHPHISYRDLGLLYAYHNGSAWQITVVDDDFFAGASSSLTLNSAAAPHIGYSDWAVPDHDLRYAHFDHHSWWLEVVEVAAVARCIEQVSQVLDAAKRAHIGYCDVGANTTLRYAVRDAAPSLNRVYLSRVVLQD